MKRAALLLLLSATALAQGKVVQRKADSECTAGTFTSAGLRVCNLHDALSSVPLVFVSGHYERLDWQVESSGEELLLWSRTTRARAGCDCPR